MSFYMVVKSNSNLHYFPNNKPHHFKSKMSQTLYLDGKWEAALCEAKINKKFNNSSSPSFDINTNICSESIIDGVYGSLLRRVHGDKRHQVLTFPYNIPVIKSEINEIEILIKSEDAKEELLIDPTEVVLHFKSIVTEREV